MARAAAALGLLGSLILLLVGCKKYPYDLAKVRQEGDAIVAAMKQYQSETGEQYRSRLCDLSPKYLANAIVCGSKPGQWTMGYDDQTRKSNEICISFQLDDKFESQAYDLFKESEGWKVRSDAHSPT